MFSYIYNGFDDYICSVYKILSIYIYRSHHKKRTRTGVSITIYGCSNSNALSLNTSKLFNYEFGNYMKITAIITALLALPFIIKSLKTDVPQKFGRKLSVVFAAFIIAFTISFPINFFIYIDGATHENCNCNRQKD